MTDKLIEQIKADREAGTPGPWRIQDCESYGDRCKTFFKQVWNEETDILVTTEVTRAHNDGGTANMRRIARVPEYEARILANERVIKAAVELAEALSAYNRGGAGPLTGWIDVEQALDALYRAMQDRKGKDEPSHTNQEVVGPDDPELLEILHGQT